MIEKTRLKLLKVLAKLSEQFPEVRLGQLINNLATLVKGPQIEAIWDAEDKELLEAAKNNSKYFDPAIQQQLDAKRRKSKL